MNATGQNSVGYGQKNDEMRYSIEHTLSKI
jgi:hypothetical protein